MIPPDVAFVPADRQRDALVLDFTLAENTALRGAGAAGGLLAWRSIVAQAAAAMVHFDVRAAMCGGPFEAEGLKITAHEHAHGATTALAFRIEEAGKVFVYASDVGYLESGPSAEDLACYANAAKPCPISRQASAHRAALPNASASRNRFSGRSNVA